MAGEQEEPTGEEVSLPGAGTAPRIENLGREAGSDHVGGVDGRRALKREHEASFHEFLDSWLGPEQRSEEDFSVNYAAYHALAHAGMLLRVTGTDAIPAELATLPSERRAKIVLNACEFVFGFGIPAHLSHILSDATPEPEDIEEFEHVLRQRDELDVVIELSKRVVADAVKTDEALLAKLADAISVAAEFDDEFLKRPDLMATCSRILVALRPLNWLANGSYPDWFALARSWDCESNIEQVLAGKNATPMSAKE